MDAPFKLLMKPHMPQLTGDIFDNERLKALEIDPKQQTCSIFLQTFNDAHFHLEMFGYIVALNSDFNVFDLSMYMKYELHTSNAIPEWNIIHFTLKDAFDFLQCLEMTPVCRLFHNWIYIVIKNDFPHLLEGFTLKTVDKKLFQLVRK